MLDKFKQKVNQLNYEVTSSLSEVQYSPHSKPLNPYLMTFWNKHSLPTCHYFFDEGIIG